MYNAIPFRKFLFKPSPSYLHVWDKIIYRKLQGIISLYKFLNERAYWNITNFQVSSLEQHFAEDNLFGELFQKELQHHEWLLCTAGVKWIIYQICFHYFSVKTLKIYFPSTQFQQSFVHRAGLYLDKYLWICFHMKNESYYKHKHCTIFWKHKVNN